MIDRGGNASRAAAAARGLVLLRLVAGGIFLYAGAGKMTFHQVLGFLPLPVASLDWQLELPARLATWLASHPASPLTAVVRDLLIPHGMVVAALVAWGQTLAGALLLTGWYTVVASALGALVAITLAIAASAGGPIDARPYILLVALCLAFAIGRAGDTMGLDAWRRERRRNREL